MICEVRPVRPVRSPNTNHHHQQESKSQIRNWTSTSQASSSGFYHLFIHNRAEQRDMADTRAENQEPMKDTKKGRRTFYPNGGSGRDATLF